MFNTLLISYFIYQGFYITNIPTKKKYNSISTNKHKNIVIYSKFNYNNLWHKI